MFLIYRLFWTLVSESCLSFLSPKKKKSFSNHTFCKSQKGSMLIIMGFGYLLLAVGLALVIELSIASHIGASVSTTARLGAAAVRDGVDPTLVINQRISKINTGSVSDFEWTTDGSFFTVNISSLAYMGETIGLGDFRMRSSAPIK